MLKRISLVREEVINVEQANGEFKKVTIPAGTKGTIVRQEKQAICEPMPMLYWVKLEGNLDDNYFDLCLWRDEFRRVLF